MFKSIIVEIWGLGGDNVFKGKFVESRDMINKCDYCEKYRGVRYLEF